MIAHVLATLTLLAVALLLGATCYEGVVMAPNYERDVPASLELARRFLQRTTPAHYFRVVAPLAQILALLTVIAGWNGPGRQAFAVALGLLIIADVITFHVPLSAARRHVQVHGASGFGPPCARGAGVVDRELDPGSDSRSRVHGRAARGVAARTTRSWVTSSGRAASRMTDTVHP